MTPREELRALLLEKSIRKGEFTLSSGQTSDFYIDCRTSTIHARGAILIGMLGCNLIEREALRQNQIIDSIGGLTLGADPISLAIAMESCRRHGFPHLRPFVVRKEPKEHGMGKQIEGSFQTGDRVVVIDDTATTGNSALKAAKNIESHGGKVAFVLTLVDREEGGKEAIEAAGYRAISLFTKSQLL